MEVRMPHALRFTTYLPDFWPQLCPDVIERCFIGTFNHETYQHFILLRIKWQSISCISCLTHRKNLLLTLNSMLYSLVPKISVPFRILLFSYVGSIAFKAAYGYEIQSENDFYIKLVGIAMEPLLLVVHGNYLVDFLPFLKYIPGKTLNIS